MRFFVLTFSKIRYSFYEKSKGSNKMKYSMKKKKGLSAFKLII